MDDGFDRNVELPWLDEVTAPPLDIGAVESISTLSGSSSSSPYFDGVHAVLFLLYLGVEVFDGFVQVSNPGLEE